MKRRKRNVGSTQGHALLYGLSSKAIRIVYGKKVGSDDDQQAYPKRRKVAVQSNSIVKKGGLKKQEQQNYRMSQEAAKKLDKLQDPLTMMTRHARTQKYEVAESSEKYEYGLSDW